MFDESKDKLRFTIFHSYMTQGLQGEVLVESEILDTTYGELEDNILAMLSSPGGGDKEGAITVSMTVNLSTRQAVTL